ncbi:MAG: hypothetical protein KatS3mg011_0776 [Acidimicrobiia bacterium]|nr:MAG: hypothetical protein KatS3mg011_0776 [Acidimicrobiia bacterium]
MVELTPDETAILQGERGPGLQFAARIVTAAAQAVGASRLVEITRAHVDGCLYHGVASLDFARRLVEGGARVAVPTTLNVGGVDLLHPELWRGEPDHARAAAELMELYVALGCTPTFTCAPYQLADRPGLGETIAWAESNAIVFANSVLGARTNRNGDFLDIACALLGKAPYYGLLTDEGRRAEVMIDLSPVGERILASDGAAAVVGHLTGLVAGDRIPLLVGLPPDVGEDYLKAVGAAAASSGSVAMFHVLGVTPEAPDVETATGGRPVERVVFDRDALIAARDDLDSRTGDRLGAVALGTPHFSLEEFRRADRIVREEGIRVPDGFPIWINTSRTVLEQAESEGVTRSLVEQGARIVVDTCTYVAPLMEPVDGVVMTNSGKWAFYAPSNLGVEVAFGSLRECLVSAGLGRVWRDPEVWGA